MLGRTILSGFGPRHPVPDCPNPARARYCPPHSTERVRLHIAIIAWGSLVWDSEPLAITLPFRPAGPRLTIAFSRISRDGRLTLVLDEKNGTPCSTFIAPSAAATLDEAIANLAAREGTAKSDIGFVDRRNAKSSDVARERHPLALQAIEAWAAASGHDYAIWTALPSNFREKTRRLFSVSAAMDYLASLDEPARERALMYIRRTPHQVRSLLRNEVAQRWPG